MNKSKSDSQLLNFQNFVFKPLQKTAFICNEYTPVTINGPCRYCLKPNCQNNITKKLSNSSIKFKSLKCLGKIIVQ